MTRDDALTHIREHTAPWEVVIIGGGATGVGCALDAASRGYKVLLLEQHDLGKGTSSRSTKLVHGGVRYLAQGNISLVRQSLRERGLLFRNAPHVVRRQAFIIPCYSLWQKAYYAAGLKIYDLLAGKYGLGPSRVLSRDETTERLPTINSEHLNGGVLYYDGQFDDTRLLFDLAAAARRHGATILNYARVRSLTKDEAGKVAGLSFENVETGEVFDVSARVVINATGAFCDAVRTMSDKSSVSLVTLSQGVHLVFAKSFLPSGDAVMIPRTSDGRVLFCIPWLGATLVGTTDTPVDHAEIEPHALETEIDFIIETAGMYLTGRPTRADILSVFAGIRPLVRSGATRNTAKLSRGHTIETDDAGLVTITGGKWTTYRQMAEDAVDRAAMIAGLRGRASVTKALEIDAPADTPDGDDQTLHPDLLITRDDVIRAVRGEMARTIEDVLARRVRSLFLNARAAITVAPEVAAIMAAELGNDHNWIKQQVEEFTRTASEYLVAQTHGS